MAKVTLISHGSLGSTGRFSLKACLAAVVIGGCMSKVASHMSGASFHLGLSLFLSLHIPLTLHVIWPFHSVVVSEWSCIMTGLQEEEVEATGSGLALLTSCVLLQQSQSCPDSREGRWRNRLHSSLKVRVAESHCRRECVVADNHVTILKPAYTPLIDLQKSGSMPYTISAHSRCWKNLFEQINE